PVSTAWFPLPVVGPMARTVADIALQLTAIAGPDARSPISLPEPGSIFARPLERDFKNVRLAWSRDLGGLPVDPRVTVVGHAQRQVFEEIGMVVEDGQPDLAEADEIFKVLRAHHFAAYYGDLLKTKPDQLKDTVIWNIEEGLRLTGPQVGRAEIMRTELYHRV